MLLAKRIRQERQSRQLTQKELGNLVNVTKVSICCYENGTRTPTLDTLVELASVFDVSLDYLLGKEKEVVVLKSKEKPVRMAKEEIDFIEALRQDEVIYPFIVENPKRCASLIGKKLR